MTFELTTRQWGLAAAGVILAAYVLFQARFIILGPQVTILYPREAETAQSQVVSVGGTASNVAWISLNGRQIYTDEQGRWEETLLLSPGVSIMTVVVRDRFGREKTESIRIILNG